MNSVASPSPKRRTDVNMTEGSIIKQLIFFALPLLAGNVFQQLYNIVDTWVVGNFAGDAAFAAVGSVGSIMNMLIGFFGGLSGGAGVVISQYFGAGRLDKVRDTVHASVLITLVLGALFTVLGIFMTPYLLRFNNTPDEVFPEAHTYLTIYYAGFFGLMIYNMGSAILRAVGDSRRPFYFLVVSAVINTVLDLLFVAVFNMGVAGAALATVIAQGISAVLVIIVLLTTGSSVRFSPREFVRGLRSSLSVIGPILAVGLPTAIQMAITSFSNVFIQSYINQFGKHCMSGWTAYSKVDQLLFLPMQTLAVAISTFVGQNLGADKPDRARRGVNVSVIISLVSTAMLMIPVIAFAPFVVTLFIDTPAAVDYGTLFLRYVTPFYLVCVFNQIYSGAQRGAGNSRIPMIIMLSSFVLFRQAYMYVVSTYISNTELAVAMGYPAGWIVAAVLSTVYYFAVGFKGYKSKK